MLLKSVLLKSTSRLLLLSAFALAGSPAVAQPVRPHAKSVHGERLLAVTDVSAARRHVHHRHGRRIRHAHTRRVRIAARSVAARPVVDRFGAAYQNAPSPDIAGSVILRGRTTASQPRRQRITEMPAPAGRAVVGNGLIAEARRYLGTNPTGRAHLWCGHFMNLVLRRSGRPASDSNTARSFASYGHRVSGPQIGAIAVMSRGRRGGHVGIVSGIDANGNPIIISGNHGGRVAETVYPRGRIFAYVMP